MESDEDGCSKFSLARPCFRTAMSCRLPPSADPPGVPRLSSPLLDVLGRKRSSRIRGLSLDHAKRTSRAGCAVGMNDPPMIISDGDPTVESGGDRGPTPSGPLEGGELRAPMAFAA